MGVARCIDFQNVPVVTKNVLAAENWKRVSTAFNSGELSEIKLNLLFGGWGRCSGTAWFDDVSLVKQDQSARLAAIVKCVSQAFTARAGGAEMATLRKLLAEHPGSAADFVLASLVKPELPAATISLESLAKTHQILRLSTLEGMKFSTQRLVAKAGQPIALEFTDPDAMQHNFVLGKPASLQTIGAAANALANQPDGYQKAFRPDIPEVLAASSLLNPHETGIVVIPALPPGTYPYMCTFPGHWMIMNGTLAVTSTVKTTGPLLRQQS